MKTCKCVHSIDVYRNDVLDVYSLNVKVFLLQTTVLAWFFQLFSFLLFIDFDVLFGKHAKEK